MGPGMRELGKKNLRTPVYSVQSHHESRSSSSRSRGHSIRLKTTWLTHDVGVETTSGNIHFRVDSGLVSFQLQPRVFGHQSTTVRFWLDFKVDARPPKTSFSAYGAGLTWGLNHEPMFKITASGDLAPLTSTRSLRGFTSSRYRLPIQKLRSRCAETQNGGLNLCSNLPRRRRAVSETPQLNLNFNLKSSGPGVATDWFKVLDPGQWSPKALSSACAESTHDLGLNLCSNFKITVSTLRGFEFHPRSSRRRTSLKLTLLGALTSQRIQRELRPGGQTVGLTACKSGCQCEGWSSKLGVDEAMRSRLGGETEVDAVQLRVGFSGGAACCPTHNLVIGIVVAINRGWNRRCFPQHREASHQRKSRSGPLPQCWRGHHEGRFHKLVSLPPPRRRRRVSLTTSVDELAPVLVLVLGANRRGVPEQRGLLARVVGVVVFCEGLSCLAAGLGWGR
ncbi:hypothetical protein C8R46DRAFT_1037587 [Mycena filopes]|nr:hypothetical protein C8R46DRAFT_1037587 [Mycena filopes]